jgi:hypothetical protein
MTSRSKSLGSGRFIIFMTRRKSSAMPCRIWQIWTASSMPQSWAAFASLSGT